jgi:hypothetical protein
LEGDSPFVREERLVANGAELYTTDARCRIKIEIRHAECGRDPRTAVPSSKHRLARRARSFSRRRGSLAREGV